MRKEEIVKNLTQIKELLDDDCPNIAAVRLNTLISEIKESNKKESLWDILLSKND
jgi:hypothetical protein